MENERGLPVKILLVEDNQEHRRLIKKNLQRGSRLFDIEEAENGEDCLKRMGQSRFELVLLDYSLPDASGLEVLARIRKHHNGVPVIMVTGQGNEQIIHDAICLGASDYIIKSLEFLEHLSAVVEKTLAQQALKVQLDRSKEELLKRSEELAILLDATTAVTSELDLDNVLTILSERIRKSVTCTFVKILLTADDGGKLVVRAAHPVQNEKWDPALGHTFEVRPGSLILSVMANRSPLLVRSREINELDADPEMQRGLLGSMQEVQSLLVVPITMKHECLGVVVLGERRQWEREPFTIEKSSLALALVQHAGIAIKNAFQYQSLQKAHLQTIVGLAEALETRDTYTGGHSDRAMEHAQAIARKLDLTQEQTERLRYAVVLHDIGKIGIPDAILNKPGKLTNEEYDIMKSHPVKGSNILSKIYFLQHIAPLVRHHHERLDGAGYPDRMTGPAIPIESRIVSVLDSYDAMTSDRVYRKAPGKEFAIAELTRCAGTQFDPRVVAAFLEVLHNAPE